MNPNFNKKIVNVEGYRPDTILKREEINCLFDDGGLGDNICRLSVIKYIEKYCPHVTLHLWVPDYFYDITKYAFPNLDVQPHSNNKNYNDKIAGLRGGGFQHTSIKTHLIDHAFHVILDRQVEIEHKNYLQLDTSIIDIAKFVLPEKYVVVTTGFTAEVRELIPETINGISDYCLAKGYTPVYLGNEKSTTGAGEDITGNFKKQIDFSKGINLVNKTSLLEAHKIISGAACIVGNDNGLLHLAGMTQTKIVYGLTTVEPRLRLPYRHNTLGWNCDVVTPPEDLACRFCQSKMTLVYDFDFRKCYYNDKKCIYTLTTDKFIDKLKDVL